MDTTDQTSCVDLVGKLQSGTSSSMQEVYLQTSCISTGLFASCQQTVTSRTLSGLLFYPNTGTNLYHLLVEFFFIAFFLHSDFSIEGLRAVSTMG